MKVCYTGGAVKDCGSYYSIATNAVELRIWFLTDDILRIRAGFDGDWDEASYSLTMTAWESRTDNLMKDCRKRVQCAAATLTDGEKEAVIQGSRLKVVVEKAPFRIMVYDKDGSLLHADIPDLAYREDSNHRRIHASQIEADDCFYGFGEKSGEINKAEKYMNMAPGDAMGYNPKETDSLYKHIPFYIRLNRGSNGYGKTTLARTICGLMEPLAGRIAWQGRPADAKTRLRSSFLVMQDVNYQLFSDSVREEVLLGAAEPERCDEVLQALGLDALADRHPMSLLGGQKQRVVVAAAIVSGKPLILLDEPTSGLDRRSMEQVGGLLRDLKARGRTVLVITHDEELAAEYCDRIIRLEPHREGESV